MAEVRSITIRFGSTHPTGDYRNVTASYELTADLMPGDDLKVVSDVMWGVARTNVKAQILSAIANVEGKTAREVYNGIPPEMAEVLRVVEARVP